MRWFSRNRLFVLIAATYFYFFSGGDPNQTSRLLLTAAIVERHAVDITPGHSHTIDDGQYKGKFYSDKAPGVSFFATLPYATMSAIDRALGRDPHPTTVQRVRLHMLTFVLAGLPAVLSAWLLMQLLLRFGTRERHAELLTFGYAIGTITFPFATVMFGHALATLGIVAAFYFVVAWRHEPHPVPLSFARLFGLGLLLASTVIVEYPVGMLGAVLGAYVIYPHVRLGAWREVARIGLGVAAGAAGPLVLHSAFLYAAFGSPFSLPYNHLVEPAFISHTASGLLGIGIPTKDATYGSLVSAYRGIFFLNPFLALAFAGFASWIAESKRRFAAEGWTIGAMTAIYFAFCCSYYAWDGGGSTGPRHLVPLLPFLVVALSRFSDRNRYSRALTTALIAVSALVMLACVAVIIQQPEGDPYRASPFYKLVLPSLLRGEMGMNPQDSFFPRLQNDASYNLGTLLGLAPWASLLVLAALWVTVYGLALMPRRLPPPAQSTTS